MKKQKLIDFYVITLLISALSAVILRTYALISDFDSQIMQFSNSIASTLSGAIVIIATLYSGKIEFIKLIAYIHKLY